MSTLIISGSCRHVDPAIGLDENILSRPNERIERTILGEASGILYQVGIVTPTSIPMGTVTTPGEAWFMNYSTTDKIQIGYTISAVFRPFVEIPPLRWNRLSLHAPHTFEALAIGSAVDLGYAIFQQEP